MELTQCFEQGCKREVMYACPCNSPKILSCEKHFGKHLAQPDKAHAIERIFIEPCKGTKEAILGFFTKEQSKNNRLKEKILESFSQRLIESESDIEGLLKDLDSNSAELRNYITKISQIQKLSKTEQDPIIGLLSLHPDEAIEKLKKIIPSNQELYSSARIFCGLNEKVEKMIGHFIEDKFETYLNARLFIIENTLKEYNKSTNSSNKKFEALDKRVFSIKNTLEEYNKSSNSSNEKFEGLSKRFSNIENILEEYNKATNLSNKKFEVLSKSFFSIENTLERHNKAIYSNNDEYKKIIESMGNELANIKDTISNLINENKKGRKNLENLKEEINSKMENEMDQINSQIINLNQDLKKINKFINPGNQELNYSETDKGEASQSEDQNYPGSNTPIKHIAMEWVDKMACNSESRGAILEIGKDPRLYDKLFEKSLQDPNTSLFFRVCKSEIIKLCKVQVDKSIFTQKVIEHFLDREIYNPDYEKIVTLCNSGQNEKALDLCNEGIKMNPKDGIFHSSKVSLLATLGRNEEAFDAYKEAIKINTRPINLYIWRGQVLDLMGRKVEALAVLSEGIFYWPNKAGLLILKGKILYGLNEIEESIKYFILAFKLDATLSAIDFKKTFPDANKIFVEQFPGFSIKKGLKCDICNLIFTDNDTQYLCLYCDPAHYHCEKCEKIIKDNVAGSAKFVHPHSTFVIHSKTRQLNKLKFGASTHKNIEFQSDQENKKHACFCDNSDSGYCDGEVEGNRYKCSHCIDFDLCEGCQNKFLEGEMKTEDCLKNSGHKIWHVMIKMKIP